MAPINHRLVHQASAKRSHDASEVYDGVPSSHDAKSASILSRFHHDDPNKVWVELSEEERSLNGLIDSMRCTKANVKAI
ncbi:MAG: hypothetical protein ACJAUP_000168 [Cellvibrionaceae bacterium]